MNKEESMSKLNRIRSMIDNKLSFILGDMDEVHSDGDEVHSECVEPVIMEHTKFYSSIVDKRLPKKQKKNEIKKEEMEVSFREVK